REHTIEKRREKEFMISLLSDLKKDSVALAHNVQVGPRIVRYSDSLTSELSKRPLLGREKRLYHFSSLVGEGVDFRYYDRTVSQLRNSGGFRLISKSEVSNALLDYDVLMREAQSYTTGVESWSFITPALQKSAVIFDIGLIFKIYDEEREHINSTDSIHFPPGLKLITYDEAVIKEYENL